MSVKLEIPEKEAVDRVADANGVAVAAVARRGIEISVSNNNSICRKLNPDGRMVGACAAFCGTALEEIIEAGGEVSYTCHAGLECSADEMEVDGQSVAVIVGRTFVRADNYRKATERAISGDWQQYSPSEFFENILLTGSKDVLERTLGELRKLAVPVEAAIAESAEPGEMPIAEPDNPESEELADDQIAEPEVPEGSERADLPVDDAEATDITTSEPPTGEEPAERPAEKGPIEMAAEIARLAEQINRKASGTSLGPAEPKRLTTDVGAWRSFFSSILNKDYISACDALLEFLANHFHLESLVWLERQEDNLVTVASLGSPKKPRVRLAIAADDQRLADSIRHETPIQLTERSGHDRADARTMSLFPVPVGSEIPSALAVLDPIGDEQVQRQISRLCHSVGPQLEILRLRSEVSRRNMLSLAVRKFSDGLKYVDSDDFWTNVTSIAAELMQAERGSLLVLNEANNSLEIKAAVGIRGDISSEAEPGRRVAKIIFERGKPVVVAEVEKTGLPPFPPERAYKTSSFLSAPVALGGRNIGVINFTDKANGGAFDRTDLTLLQEIAPQIAVAIDRALLKEKAGEFEQLSVTDALTGLLNRRYIEERLVEEVKRSNRHGYPMSYVSIDVDHFKSYNDEFGHPAGDEALKIVAHILKDTLRGADIAARVGGEEFAILLPQTTNDESTAIAERLRSKVAAAAFPCRQVTVSIGVASCSSELCTTDGLVKAADKALYAAKHSGRNTVRIYDEIDEN